MKKITILASIILGIMFPSIAFAGGLEFTVLDFSIMIFVVLVALGLLGLIIWKNIKNKYYKKTTILTSIIILIILIFFINIAGKSIVLYAIAWLFVFPFIWGFFWGINKFRKTKKWLYLLASLPLSSFFILNWNFIGDIIEAIFIEHLIGNIYGIGLLLLIFLPYIIFKINSSNFMEKLENININDINFIKLKPNIGKEFIVKNEPLVKIIYLITKKEKKAEFGPNELKKIYEEILVKYKSNLSKSEYETKKVLIKEFVEEGGKIDIINKNNYE